MKERLLNALAWGVWVWGMFFAVLMTAAYLSDQGIDGDRITPAVAAVGIAGFSVAPILVQWLLFYVLTGFPRFLPWKK